MNPEKTKKNLGASKTHPNNNNQEVRNKNVMRNPTNRTSKQTS